MSSSQPTILAGRFALGPLVAAGGFGEVYRARDLTTGREVAVKRMSARGIEPSARTRFEREAELLATASSPHVVGYVAHGEEPEGEFYLATDWLDGETLAARLVRDGALPVPLALSIVAQAAEGLEALHALGILHRDIKPGNIVLVRSGGARPRATLIDLGIARGRDQTRLTAGDVVMGSPEYLAPEQARGEAATASSDVYSLAVVFFEMVTGRRPFAGTDPIAVVGEVLERAAPRVRALRPELPPDLDPVLERALAKEPAGRFATARELAQALSGACARAAVDAEADDVTLRIHDPSRRAARPASQRLLAVASAGAPSFDALIARADASLAKARVAQSLAHARAALECAGDAVARRLEAASRVARAELESARPVEASEALRAALASAERVPPDAAAWTARIERARVLVARGRARDALETLRAVTDDAIAGEATREELARLRDAVAAEAALQRGELREAVAAFTAARDSGEGARAIPAGVGLGRALVQLGAFADAAQVLGAARREASAVGRLGDEVVATAVRAVALARMEQAEAGLAEATEAVALASRAALPRAGAIAAVCAATLAVELGGEWLAQGSQALRAAAPAIEPFAPLRAVADALRAELALVAGDAEEATRLAAEAFLLVERSGAFDGAEVPVWLTYVRALRAAGRGREADAVLEQARTRLHERASALGDEALRDALLEDVPENRALLALAAERLGR